jgi:predicted DNA-binding protein (MmcQ/YjbR family)
MTRQELLDWVKAEYGTEAEYQWIKFPNYAVLRNKDGKWYGIIMDVPKNKFGIDSNDIVDVLDVKADMMLIDLLINQPGFYRAYHMNKTQWISVFLDGTADDVIIKNLLADSYEKTSKKRNT